MINGIQGISTSTSAQITDLESEYFADLQQAATTHGLLEAELDEVTSSLNELSNIYKGQKQRLNRISDSLSSLQSLNSSQQQILSEIESKRSSLQESLQSAINSEAEEIMTEIKSTAEQLRNDIQRIRNENQGLEDNNEVIKQQITEELKLLPDPELEKLLFDTEQKLLECQTAIERQSIQTKELDYQIVKLRLLKQQGLKRPRNKKKRH